MNINYLFYPSYFRHWFGTVRYFDGFCHFRNGIKLFIPLGTCPSCTNVIYGTSPYFLGKIRYCMACYVSSFQWMQTFGKFTYFECFFVGKKLALAEFAVREWISIAKVSFSSCQRNLIKNIFQIEMRHFKWDILNGRK